MLTQTIPYPLSRPSDERGMVIAPEVGEKRKKRKNEGEGGKKRAHPEGSTPSLPPQRKAMLATEEGHNLALIPLATIAPSEGAQFQQFEETLKASGNAHDQSSSKSSTIASKGEKG